MQKDKNEDLPHRDLKQVEKEAEKKRKDMDEIPPHGTDPLHEGP